MQIAAKTLVGLVALLCSSWIHAAVNCGISSSPLTFGVFDPDGNSVDSENGLVNVTCQAVSQPTPVSIVYTVSISTGNSGSYLMRRMSNGANNLLYNIYVSGTRLPNLVWGDTTSGTLMVGGTIPNLSNATPMDSREHTVYGRIPGPQTGLAPGTYTDSLVIVLSF